MVKIGLWLPVFGGWLGARGSGRAALDGAAFSGEEEQAPTYEYLKKIAIEADKIGIHSLWIADHLLNFIKGENAPCPEAWTLAAALAASTKKVILTHTTLCEAFRYPAVLAKQAATLSEIAGGRFWLSIGAGAYKREFEAYGLPFYAHDERVARAGEAIQIIKRLWTENDVSYTGRCYSISHGVLEPKPDKIPPIWYAGNSEVSRNLVAAEANGWLMRNSTVEQVRDNVNGMLTRLSNKGRGRVEFAVPCWTFIKDSDAEARDYVLRLAENRRETLERIMNTGLAGSPETVAAKIKAFEKAGVDYVLLQITPALRELKNIEKVLSLI